jgi:hypothetical protein
MVNEQAPVPADAQAPAHPANEPPPVGAALRVTFVPSANCAVHVPLEHEMPDGEEVTPPVPLPATMTVSVLLMTPGGSNVAVMVALPFIASWQVAPAAVQGPIQPPNVEPFAAGVAVSVTAVPWAKLALHVPDEQEIPDGDELTEPPPVPARVTVSVW